MSSSSNRTHLMWALCHWPHLFKVEETHITPEKTLLLCGGASSKTLTSLLDSPNCSSAGSIASTPLSIVAVATPGFLRPLPTRTVAHWHRYRTAPQLLVHILSAASRGVSQLELKLGRGAVI